MSNEIQEMISSLREELNLSFFTVTFEHLTPWASRLAQMSRCGASHNIHFFLDQSLSKVCRVWVHNMDADESKGEEYTLENRDFNLDLCWAEYGAIEPKPATRKKKVEVLPPLNDDDFLEIEIEE